MKTSLRASELLSLCHFVALARFSQSRWFMRDVAETRDPSYWLIYALF